MNLHVVGGRALIGSVPFLWFVQWTAHGGIFSVLLNVRRRVLEAGAPRNAAHCLFILRFVLPRHGHYVAA